MESQPHSGKTGRPCNARAVGHASQVNLWYSLRRVPSERASEAEEKFDLSAAANRSGERRQNYFVVTVAAEEEEEAEEKEEEAKYFSLSRGPVVRRPLLISPSHRHLRLPQLQYHFCVQVARFLEPRNRAHV